MRTSMRVAMILMAGAERALCLHLHSTATWPCKATLREYRRVLMYRNLAQLVEIRGKLPLDFSLGSLESHGQCLTLVVPA